MCIRCRGLLVNCIDPRLQGSNAVRIARFAGLSEGEYEQLNYAGPSLWCTDPHEKSHEEMFWWTLKQVSLPLHEIREIVLVGHSGCGGFALKSAIADQFHEQSVIFSSLRQAKAAIQSRFPDLTVKLVFVTICEDVSRDLPSIICQAVN